MCDIITIIRSQLHTHPHSCHHLLTKRIVMSHPENPCESFSPFLLLFCFPVPTEGIIIQFMFQSTLYLYLYSLFSTSSSKAV